MIHATSDDSGRISGVYDTDIHSLIPEGAYPLPDADYQAWLRAADIRWTGSAWSAHTPGPEELVAARRADLVAAITARAAVEINAGAPVTGGLHVAMTDASRADLSGMATTALAALSGAVEWPQSYVEGWITIENVRIALPAPAVGLGLAASVGDHYARIVQRRRTLKDAVQAATDVAALDAIDIEAGWPAPED